MAEMQKSVEEVISLKPLNRKWIQITIKGISPLVQHNWSDKAKREMREKHAGKKTKNREVRNPEQEGIDAMYITDDGLPGIPLKAVKKSLIHAAHRDLGIEKTLVKKAIFVHGGGKAEVIPIETSGPEFQEDYVRVGMGGTDLRYRPCFDDWKCRLNIEYDADLIQPPDLVNLINRAGFGVGLCEFRPERGGDWGRFEVVTE